MPTPRTRTIVIACAALLAVLAGALTWIGVRAILAKGELDALMPIAREVVAAAEARDLARIDDLSRDMQRHAASAAALTGDPVWGLAMAMPVLGPNFAAVQKVSRHIDAIAREASPLLSLAREAEGDGGPARGGFDLVLLDRASTSLLATAHAVADAETDLARIRTQELIAPLADGVSTVSRAVSDVAPMLEVLADVSEVLPGILGADGPRSVLLITQNPAEPRTGGGITGSFALLEADGSDLTLADQVDSGAFTDGSDGAIRPVPASTVELYGDVVGRFVTNASMPADFRVTADLALAWWQEQSDIVPDAVISIDPFVLAAMVSASAPIELPDGSELSGENVVERLLVDSYLDLDRDEQTVLQRAVTTAAFAQLVSGSLDLIPFAEALAPVVAEGRFSLWSADADEQAIIEDGLLGGPAARQRVAGEGAYAVYVNDATAGKMGAYLHTEVAVSSVECRADGQADVVVRVTLANSAPPDAGATLPWWVTGGGIEGVEPGHVGLTVTVAAPPDSFFGGVSRAGETLLSTNVVDAGFPSSLVHVDLAPGDGAVLDFRFIAADASHPTLLTTPLLRPAVVDDEFVADCAA